MKTGDLVSVWDGKDYFNFNYIPALVIKKDPSVEIRPALYLVLVGETFGWYSEDMIRPMETK